MAWAVWHVLRDLGALIVHGGDARDGIGMTNMPCRAMADAIHLVGSTKKAKPVMKLSKILAPAPREYDGMRDGPSKASLTATVPTSESSVRALTIDISSLQQTAQRSARTM